jgi:hypothetical protein
MFTTKNSKGENKGVAFSCFLGPQYLLISTMPYLGTSTLIVCELALQSRPQVTAASQAGDSRVIQAKKKKEFKKLPNSAQKAKQTGDRRFSAHLVATPSTSHAATATPPFRAAST